MILDLSDPTGIGLFSRAARSQAAKVKPNRPSTPSRNLSVQHSAPTVKKNIKNVSTFSRQESRAQRQKKFKVQETPPVGQYNPIRKQRPKMVWDILKAYASPNRASELKIYKNNPTQTPKTVSAPQSVVGSANSTPTQMEEALIDHSAISEAAKNRCMVNMSRMSGRKFKQVIGGDWGESDVMHSLGYCRGSVAKNIYLGKGGEKQDSRNNLGESYNYDYNLIKPKRGCNMDFSRCLGRNEKPIEKDDSYNYVHYDYDSYVWGGRSSVFPNTKTHVISFEKQKNRYASKHYTHQQQQC